LTAGDWSRVGVISKDVENGLKPLVVALGVFHVGCALVAGRAAASKNIAVYPAVLKVPGLHRHSWPDNSMVRCC
jgi:hypothetical protein